MTTLTADDLLYGYINGIFPMAEPDGTIYWYSPDPRAIIPIDTYKPPKSLRPVINKRTFEIRVDSDFEGVMRGCAGPRTQEDGTWISEDIISAYTDLHKLGYAHSVEAYRENKLVGGLYGVSINGVFFGESMFSYESNSSKVAFHYLIEILRVNGFNCWIRSLSMIMCFVMEPLKFHVTITWKQLTKGTCRLNRKFNFKSARKHCFSANILLFNNRVTQ